MDAKKLYSFHSSSLSIYLPKETGGWQSRSEAHKPPYFISRLGSFDILQWTGCEGMFCAGKRLGALQAINE
ncbi:hypothetical protein VTL71DRAFT_15425 [Oculimacula yallundae]|uniref:Uncharacterized protein n=1 Tax=Oculimacula yallundae TaxID=86028 RepID=A0ABR4CHA7_9HELO